ncbi:MAG: hypothetical protein ACODAE_07680 [Gemmatimonadota bacterium]
MPIRLPPHSMSVAGRELQGLARLLLGREARADQRARAETQTEMEKRRLGLAEDAAARAEEQQAFGAEEARRRAEERGHVFSEAVPATEVDLDTEIELPESGIGMAADAPAEGAPGFADALTRRLGGTEPEVAPEAGAEGPSFAGALRRRIAGETEPGADLPDMERVTFTEEGFDPLRSADFRRAVALQAMEGEEPERGVNWQIRETEDGYVQVHPQTGELRPLGIEPPPDRLGGGSGTTASTHVTERQRAINAARAVTSVDPSDYFGDDETFEREVRRRLQVFGYRDVDELSRHMRTFGLSMEDVEDGDAGGGESGGVRESITSDQADYLREVQGWTDEEIEDRYTVREEEGG